ncbi:copper resistance protein B [Sphingobium sufflavum]|uniref:copper resistance protein B n=1 Tax=Sphingobium sufflavum TaxID=1129547 RepID=UPI001F47D84B|nr:copper resistance protein B [Sphingobium sufflavum]MCE7796277.1 copper resistance protein B [Sphingobium sufflavum]
MKRIATLLALPLLSIPLLAVAVPVQAQDHAGHAGHAAPDAPAAAPSPSTEATAAAPAEKPAPAAPGDHAADAYYDPAAMARARAALRYEAGGMPNSMLLIDRLEWRPGPGADGHAWEAEGWVGGDIDRFAFKTEGEGVIGGKVEQAEVQALWSRALDPWFNLQAGVRQDLAPEPRRTHAVVGIEGLAPYWFELEGQVFLSNKGEVTARAEASYDQRITQSLILQPAAELNISAQDVPELEMGPGFTSVELGMRLRYEIMREFAPYVGVHWERKLGRTADYARAEGENPGSLRFVAGVRFWF